MNTQIIINEVDCYHGNSHKINKYASSRAVQHQIMVLNGTAEIFIGRRNKVADSDRGERVVYSEPAAKELLPLIEKVQKVYSGLKSEYCDSAEEYNKARLYNKPIKEQLKGVVNEIYKLHDLGISFDKFYNHLVY